MSEGFEEGGLKRVLDTLGIFPFSFSSFFLLTMTSLMSLKVTRKCASVISPYGLADVVLFQGLMIMVGLIYEAGAAY